jgi:hypothetical protein
MHYVTTRKVAGSIPDDIIGVFKFRNPSSRTMAKGLLRLLRGINARNPPRSKWCPAGEAHNLAVFSETIV